MDLQLGVGKIQTFSPEHSAFWQVCHFSRTPKKVSVITSKDHFRIQGYTSFGCMYFNKFKEIRLSSLLSSSRVSIIV